MSRQRVLPGRLGFFAMALIMFVAALGCMGETREDGALGGRRDKMAIERTSAELMSNGTLRVATYNVQLTSLPFRIGSGGYEIADFLPYGLADILERRVDGVTKAIQRESPDIVALNEVFEEDARDAMIDALPGYPYRVEKLEDGVYSDLADARPPAFEDSGLMLFSRLPFEGSYGDTEIGFWGVAVGRGTDLGAVYFDAYSACSGEDCYANKGFGMVQVRVSKWSTQQVLLLGFTHLQADGSLDKARTRNDQLSTASAIMRGRDHGDLGRHDGWEGIILGDLNVKGNGCYSFLADSAGRGCFDRAAGYEDMEYSDKQETGLTRYPFGFYDTWSKHHSKFDVGTTSSGGSRYDFVLKSVKGYDTPAAVSSSRVAVQHIRIPAHGQRASDHFLLVADLHEKPSFPSYFVPEAVNWHGEAGRAKPIVRPASTTAPPYSSTHTISKKGQAVWSKLEDEGTFTIEIETALDVDAKLYVYSAHNLSETVGAPETVTEETFSPTQKRVRKETYSLPQSPVYFRVSLSKHGEALGPAVGSFRIVVRRHGCSNATDDACFLEPGVDYDVRWPTGRPLNAEDVAHFKFQVPRLTSPIHGGASTGGARRWVRPYSRDEATGAPRTLALGRGGAACGYTDCHGDTSPIGPPVVMSASGALLEMDEDRYDGEANYVLALYRTSLSANPSASYSTNQVVIHGARNGLAVCGAHINYKEINPETLKHALVCKKVTLGRGGDDELKVDLWLDGGEVDTNRYEDINETDNYTALWGDYAPLPIGVSDRPQQFVATDSIGIVLHELDMFSDDDGPLRSVSLPTIFPVWRPTMPPTPKQFCATGGDWIRYLDLGGDYRYNAILSRRPFRVQEGFGL